MAKNILSLQLLRNSSAFASKDAAIAGITGSSTNDGTIKLGRYTDGDKTKTIFGIYQTIGSTAGYTIFDADSDWTSDIATRLSALEGEGSGSVASQIQAAISALDYAGVTTGDSVVITNVTETDGIVSAASANVGTLKLTGYSKGTDSGSVSASDSINAAISKLENQVDAAKAEAASAVSGLDYSDTAVEGSYVSEVDETDGVISVQRVALPTVAAISGEGQAITAVSENLGVISAVAGDIAAAHVTVADAGNVFTASTVEDVLAEINTAYKAADTAIVGDATTSGNTLGKLEDRIEALDADAATYTIRKDTESLPATVKERYTLVETKNGVATDKQVTIDIAKDSHIVSINYITTGEHAQNLEYVYLDASGNTQTTYVDMSSLVLETEFGSGVTVTNHVAHGVVDPTSENFLTVGADGFKLSGVQDAIDDKVNALDVTGDTAVAGQYVAAIEETDGVVAVKTRANVSEAVLNNYAKGSDSTDVAPTDTINQAISKLENQIDVVETQAAASKTLVAKDANASHLTISSAIDNTNSAITFTIGEDDIASKTDLDALSGKAVTGIDMTGGTAALAANTDGTKKITINTDGSQILATNYAKGTDSSPIAATDSINAALAKLENQVEKAQSAATTVVAEGTDSGNNMTVAESTATDGHKIYTINLTDVASATELDAVEAAVGLNADGTHKVTTGNYTSGASTIAGEVAALDTQVKANADNIAALSGASLSGITVNGSALTVTNNVAAVTVQGKTTEATPTGNEAIVVETDANGNLVLGIANLDAGTY